MYPRRAHLRVPIHHAQSVNTSSALFFNKLRLNTAVYPLSLRRLTSYLLTCFPPLCLVSLSYIGTRIELYRPLNNVKQTTYT